jgi:hypothetical protein
VFSVGVGIILLELCFESLLRPSKVKKLMYG